MVRLRLHHTREILTESGKSCNSAAAEDGAGPSVAGAESAGGKSDQAVANNDARTQVAAAVPAQALRRVLGRAAARRAAQDLGQGRGAGRGPHAGDLPQGAAVEHDGQVGLSTVGRMSLKPHERGCPDPLFIEKVLRGTLPTPPESVDLPGAGPDAAGVRCVRAWRGSRPTIIPVRFPRRARCSACFRRHRSVEEVPGPHRPVRAARTRHPLGADNYGKHKKCDDSQLAASTLPPALHAHELDQSGGALVCGDHPKADSKGHLAARRRLESRNTCGGPEPVRRPQDLL